MMLIVVSPDTADSREVVVVRAMLQRGLQRYHVRKPEWDDAAVARWAENFSAEERSRFVLHGTEKLARHLGFGGQHQRDVASEAAHGNAQSSTPQTKVSRLWRSRACHTLAPVREAFGIYDAVLLSPAFTSLSKPGYGATREWSDAEVQTLLASRTAADLRTRVIALGGIQKSTTARCRDLGFDGVAVLGAVWQALDPLAAFTQLRDACSDLTNRPLLAGI